MQEIITQFRPTDGSSLRTLTLRIGTPEKGAMSWSVVVEIAGFAEPVSRRIYGEDWAQAIELAARLLPILLATEVDGVGGGTLEPSFYERDAEPPDLSQLSP